MANLRTNNLSGEQGQNAYRGSVFFDGNYSFLSMSSGVVPSFGTGDFTIEFWINQGVNASNYTVLIALTSSTPSDRFEVAIHSSTIYVYTDTGAWRDTGYAPVSGVYEHIAFVRDSSGNTLKMYANGEEKWSVSNTRDYDEAWTTQIGSYASSSYGHFQGYLSNFRITDGSALYTTNYFTPPTTELTADANTVLLCCQNSDDPTQEATGKTITGFGRFADSSVELVTNPSFSNGTTGWTLSDANEGSMAVVNGSLVLTNDDSDDPPVYAWQAVTLVVGQRYVLKVHFSGGTGTPGSNLAVYLNSSSSFGSNAGGHMTADSVSGNGIKTMEFTATQTTTYVLVRINAIAAGTSIFSTVSIKAADYGDAPKVIPPYGVDAGNTFGGPIQQSSQGYMYFPTGRTEERGRGRGIIHGGYNGPSSFGYNAALSAVEIASDGVTSKFGDLFQTRYTVATAGSSTRSVFIGGGAPVSPSPFYSVNTIDFVTIATKGNAQNFGDTDEPGYFKTAVSSSTRGVFTQGRIYNPSAGTGSVDVEYITIATKGDGIQFGDLVGGGRVTLCNAAMSPTRGIFAGGVASPVSDPTSFVNTIEYVTMATLGNSVNFGDLKKSGGGGRSNGNCSSNTRGVFSVGTQSPADGNVLNFITIATTGDALDFGDLSGGMQMRGACSNQTRGLFAGGFVAPGSANYVNTCEKITIATTGSASDWGDTFEGEDGRGYNSGISDSHGGL